MRRLILRAIKDIFENRFLTVVTVATTALSVVIASSFALFILNADRLLKDWQEGIRLMVYLKPGITETQRLDTASRLKAMPGVHEVGYISKQDALALLKSQMSHHAALLDDLGENPLPDAFEVSLQPAARSGPGLRTLAEAIAAMNGVADVEYGQEWISRFTGIADLFRIGGYAVGGLFFMATIFIVANTIRLVLYARRDEIEIMRLVGATDGFIKLPIYLQGMIQGGLGALVGLGGSFGGYLFFTRHFHQDLAGALLSMHFFPPQGIALIVAAGVAVGWLGSMVSLRQFMR